MQDPVKTYWSIRLDRVKTALEFNHFEAFAASNTEEARKIVLEAILPRLEAKSVSWGGSLTFNATGLYEDLKSRSTWKVIDTYDKTLSPEEMMERRRQSLLSDLFITGTNAITEAGQLVNLDMIGNRIGGLTFGPRHVIVLAGRNKIVRNLDEAMERIRHYAAPVNAIRLGKNTPCARTADCQNCNGAERICNTWTITEKSFPKNRVRVVLINEDLGF